MLRKPHPKQALLGKAAQAKGAKAPPTPPAPHIAPLPEGFAIEAPVPSPRTTQPAALKGRLHPPVRPLPSVAGLLHLFTQGFSHWSFRPVRDPSCIHSLVSHFFSTFLQFHWSHFTQLVIPAISVLGRYFLCRRFSPVIPARPIP